MLIITSVAFSEEEQVNSVSLSRLNLNWSRCASYYALVGTSPQSSSLISITDAIIPLAKIIHRRDIIVLPSQKEKDIFCHLAKRHIDSSISKRTYILPDKFPSDQTKDIDCLVETLRIHYPTTADFTAMLTR